MNVFLAIAVDNLADADSLSPIEKEDEEEEEVTMITKSKEELEKERCRRLRKRRRRRMRRRKAKLAAANAELLDSPENGDIRMKQFSSVDDSKESNSELSDEDEYDDIDDGDDDDIDDEEDDEDLPSDDDDDELNDNRYRSNNNKIGVNINDPIIEVDSDDNGQNLQEYTGARPRRLSEVNVSKKIPPIPKHSSFFIFSHTNRFRVMCHQIINHPQFGNIVLVCILISSGMLAAEDPLNATSHRNTILNYFDWFFTTIFTIEITLKTVTDGVILHKGSFCRSYFNLLDILVVCCSLISFGLP